MVSQIKKVSPKVFLSVWVYLGWFGCVLMAQKGWDEATFIFPVIAGLLLRKSFELTLNLVLKLLSLCFLGLAFDLIMITQNLVSVQSSANVLGLPIWLISLWLLFISSLPLLQSLFQSRYFWAGLMGAIFGPLSYRAGSHFGVLELNGHGVIVTYSVFWAFLILLSIFVLRHKTKKA